jgi:filamentous hemagglutinin
MNLPNVEHALVEREKITDYLLNPAHRYGESKARFFLAFGFHLDKWEELSDALREHGQTHPITRTKATPFGPRYEIDGELNTPDGQRPRIRTVWPLDHGQLAPCLITVHPLEANS